MYIVKRDSANPILNPAMEHAWEMVAFNPSPVRTGETLHILYRAQSRPDPLLNNTGISTIAIAPWNGTHFGPSRQLVTPSEEWDKYGCEDPRAVFFEGRYYIFYTALGGIPFGPTNIKVGCAISDDLVTIAEKHLVTPFNSKAMGLFPERVNGKIAVVLSAHTDEPPSKCGLAFADKIEDLWDPAFWAEWHGENYESNLLNFLRKPADLLEVGAPPLRTKDGWLLIHSYISEYHNGSSRTFGIEAVLLDLYDPHKIIGRTENPFIVPEEAYEMYGMMPNIVFPSGAEIRGDTLDVYYGGADTVCARASLYLPHLLDAMKPGAKSRFVVRSQENPILVPKKENAWESKLVFNPGAVEIDGTVFLLYRAMSDDNTSVIGFATSSDGIHFTRDAVPCYVPRTDIELKKGSPTGNSGCEDARVTYIDGRVYICYTAYNGVQPPQVAVSSISKEDFLAKKWDAWTLPVLATPAGVDDKDAGIFPEKIGDRYMFLHRINGFICGDIIEDLSFKHPVNRCIDIMQGRKGTWESEKVGIAGVPIKTDKGWLMIYHAVSKEKHYSLGVALLESSDPSTVIARAVEPIMVVETEYEKVGEIPNVVFCNGAVVRGDTVYIYYGGADSVIGVATCSLSHLLAILTPPL